MNVDALRDYFAEVAPAAIRLGGLDCVRFVADALAIGFDRDYRAVLGYSDRASAVRRLRSAHGLEAAVSDALGPLCAKRDLGVGDVAWFPQRPASIGLIMPGYVAVKGNRAIHRVDPDCYAMGWKS